MNIEQKTTILSALFIGALVAANLMGTKIADFGIFIASTGILAFPITFLVTDIIEEVHGRERAQSLVNAGIISLVFVLIITAIAVYLPSAARDFFPAEYTKVFSASLRIFIASIIAFGISQTHDVWAFNFWKKKTNGKYLWLRNNASTLVSQLIDTTIFMFIAFYGVTPYAGVAFITALIIPYWIVKVLFAALDTPFCYLGVKWLKK
ncbi:MAG: queuosine precursor transporter [archaeon]